MKTITLTRCRKFFWWPAQRCLALPSRVLTLTNRVVLPLVAAAAIWPWAGVPAAIGLAAIVAYLQAAIAIKRNEDLANIVTTLEQVANGQLDARVAVPAHGNDAKLGIAVNTMLDGLQGLVGNLVQASSQVAGAGDQLTLAAQTLAIRSEEQASVIGNTTLAIDDVLASVRITSDMASHVDQLSQGLCDEADRSRVVVDGAVDAIGRIRTSTGEMSKALTVIDDLTFQTNILALNAAIEAARAGTAGRSFAVVAGEVRALAARTAAAATEIKNVIERSNQEVSAGVREIETVKTKIADIGQGFRNVSGQMRDVTQNNLSQSAAIGLISQGLEQLSALTQANTELVVESVGASEQLRGSAHQLDEFMQKLKGEGAGATGESVPKGASGEQLAALTPEGIEFF
ncbi:MAG: methyl-accepting chemotaxis protein [Rhizobacter sp.]